MIDETNDTGDDQGMSDTMNDQAEATADDVAGIAAKASDPDADPRGAGWYAKAALGVIALLLYIFLFIAQAKMRSTTLVVLVAVGAAAGTWIGANLLFNEVRGRWQRFLTISMGLLGALYGIILHGNRLTVGSGEGLLTWIVGPVVGAAAFAALGFVLAQTDDSSKRLTIGVASAGVIGVATGALIRDSFYPGLDPVAIVVWTAVGAAVGAAIGLLRGNRQPTTGVITGAAVGWILGAWGGADLGSGSIVESIIASVVPALAIGYAIGRSRNPDYRGRAAIDEKSRGFIFLVPSLLFITIMLVVPTIRTIYLSLLDRDSEGFVGLENYGAVFSDRDSFDTSDWTNFFTSNLTWIGGVLLVIALIVGINMKQRSGKAVEIGNPTMAPLVVGGLLVAFGLFTTLRGTIINNLWWVVTVTFFSTAIGLAIAVLADNKAGERIAKGLIFMPMAISLVGASIIWRFVYQARDVSKEQTGIMNAVWTSLGKLSTGSGIPTLVGAIVLGAIALLGLAAFARALTRREWPRTAVPGIISLLFGWLFLKYVGVLGLGLGGFEVADGELTGDADTVLFVQNLPFNNFWLMVILIWIQVGFAMVILSAAIKAVPDELIEAAKMDGATENQVFWRVTLPQISTTIGVVVTTIIVLVMKVFDIVKVTTNGQFGTNVLANDMFDEAFNIRDRGKGAALAILIFISVLPVMVTNIRRMQRES